MIRSDAIIDPCINICRMDLNGRFCQGCWRTLREIGIWDQLTDQQKAEVAAAVERRRPTFACRVTPRRDSTVLKNGLPE
ncbi:DUF1289 domain-containing protein [Paraburkholderia sabiae]|uniref:DUF1289 domain-containing protein n=1 Tax=Paraburkholderia sabiae TaxID=273251 RepID=A0ABU9QQX7_9BURK|nr:DUF1289 domain-containing protein [Paraburkholderia sabiae]WJZ72315.1 DUF1289 domain-containing protein [Paraburkholderia sabiae]